MHRQAAKAASAGPPRQPQTRPQDGSTWHGDGPGCLQDGQRRPQIVLPWLQDFRVPVVSSFRPLRTAREASKKARRWPKNIQLSQEASKTPLRQPSRAPGQPRALLIQDCQTGPREAPGGPRRLILDASRIPTNPSKKAPPRRAVFIKLSPAHIRARPGGKTKTPKDG